MKLGRRQIDSQAHFPPSPTHPEPMSVLDHILTRSRDAIYNKPPNSGTSTSQLAVVKTQIQASLAARSSPFSCLPWFFSLSQTLGLLVS